MKEKERIRNYEMMLIISPLRASDEEIATTLNRFQQVIETHGGSVTSTNHNPPWGRRRLAYPIRAYAGGEASRRNFTDGFYVLMHFSLMSTKIKELEHTIKLTDAVLRHLITIDERFMPGESTEIQDEPEDTNQQQPQQESKDTAKEKDNKDSDDEDDDDEDDDDEDDDDEDDDDEDDDDEDDNDNTG